MLKPLLALALILSTSACSMMADRFATNLGDAILDQNDPETVRAGVPAYLILIDALLVDDPDDTGLLRASATLNGAYASAFVEDPQRAAKMTEKARDHARRALCQDHPKVCETEKGPIDAFTTALEKIGKSDLESLFLYGSSWAGWIQAHSRDWNAVADLARVEAVMKRVVALDEGYDWGRAHLFLGVIKSQLPPALGGRPEEGRHHFERAIALSGGHDLVAKVEFARHYARLMFDQELHDTLLREVIEADPAVPGLTLSNTLAQRRARDLLATSKEYFED